MSSLLSVIGGPLSSLGAAVVVLGILIFFHEFGHFLVAKLSGVGVLKFSLGFGRKIVGWKFGETEYMISVFPLGGYVKMVGEEPEGEELSPEDKKRSFSEQPIYKRAAIVFAGPLFNILLAILLCYLLFVTGFPTAISKVIDVAPGSPAQAAGFMPGDIIEKVDGKDMDIWEMVSDYVEAHPGKKVDFVVRRGRAISRMEAVPENRGGKGYLGLAGSVIVAAVMENSPADKAGIKTKDHIIAVNGQRVGSWGEMSDMVKASPGKTMSFTVDRQGKTFEFKVVPVSDPKDKAGKIGVQMGADSRDVAYGPVESVGMSVNKTYQMTGMTVGFLVKLVSGKEDASQMGGPVAIVQLSGRQARQGFADFVIFMALLSVNLGVMNLFPIPILDGGHLFFFGIEAIMGKPLSMKKREMAQQVGLFLLIALMVFVFYNDIMRLLGFSVMWK